MAAPCLLWNAKYLTTELCICIITPFKSFECVFANAWSKSTAATSSANSQDGLPDRTGFFSTSLTYSCALILMV